MVDTDLLTHRVVVHEEGRLVLISYGYLLHADSYQESLEIVLPHRHALELPGVS